MIMRFPTLTSAIAAATTAMLMLTGAVQAAEASKYPDWKGAWTRWFPPGATFEPTGGFTAGGQPSHDQTKPWGPGQEAPLTPVYQKIFEESLADQANGGQGLFFDHAVRCMPGGMPLMTIAFGAMEYIVTPETTYIAPGGGEPLRRIFTDGRDWPADLANYEPTYAGYSIGKWIDEDGDGIFDVLEVETRGPFKGPRVYDATGLPLHFDNDSTFKERIFVDKGNPNILHNVITVFDRALTRPWTVDKTYRRGTHRYPNWSRTSCLEGTGYVTIGKEFYLVGADGSLMPTRKGQRPPDTSYFPEEQK